MPRTLTKGWGIFHALKTKKVGKFFAKMHIILYNLLRVEFVLSGFYSFLICTSHLIKALKHDLFLNGIHGIFFS